MAAVGTDGAWDVEAVAGMKEIGDVLTLSVTNGGGVDGSIRTQALSSLSLFSYLEDWDMYTVCRSYIRL